MACAHGVRKGDLPAAQQILSPAFLHGVKVGWRMARDDSGEGKKGMVGWSLVVLSAIGAVGLCVVLAKVT
jgi:hypothetical protein